MWDEELGEISKKRMLNLIGAIKDNTKYLTTGNIGHHRNCILGQLQELEKVIKAYRLKKEVKPNSSN